MMPVSQGMTFSPSDGPVVLYPDGVPAPRGTSPDQLPEKGAWFEGSSGWGRPELQAKGTLTMKGTEVSGS